MASVFARNLAATAVAQRAQFEFLDEHDPRLCRQIERYWTETVGGFTSCTDVPWSAVFISWCVKTAGATDAEFRFAASHSVFVNQAINHPGAFRGEDTMGAVPAIGDIIQHNRGGTTHDFAFAGTHANYPSHSAIVVETGQDADGHYALTIGGNESDAIRRKRVACDPDGRIRQRPSSPFIAILKCLK